MTTYYVAQMTGEHLTDVIAGKSPFIFRAAPSRKDGAHAFSQVVERDVIYLQRRARGDSKIVAVGVVKGCWHYVGLDRQRVKALTSKMKHPDGIGYITSVSRHSGSTDVTVIELTNITRGGVEEGLDPDTDRHGFVRIYDAFAANFVPGKTEPWVETERDVHNIASQVLQKPGILRHYDEAYAAKNPSAPAEQLSIEVAPAHDDEHHRKALAT